MDAGRGLGTGCECWLFRPRKLTWRLRGEPCSGIHGERDETGTAPHPQVPTLDPCQPLCSQGRGPGRPHAGGDGAGRATAGPSCGRGEGGGRKDGVCLEAWGSVPHLLPGRRGQGVPQTDTAAPASCPVGTKESARLRGWGATEPTVTLPGRAWGGTSAALPSPLLPSPGPPPTEVQPVSGWAVALSQSPR